MGMFWYVTSEFFIKFVPIIVAKDLCENSWAAERDFYEFDIEDFY
jgi:hypothetical protein